MCELAPFLSQAPVGPTPYHAGWVLRNVFFFSTATAKHWCPHVPACVKPASPGRWQGSCWGCTSPSQHSQGRFGMGVPPESRGKGCSCSDGVMAGPAISVPPQAQASRRFRPPEGSCLQDVQALRHHKTFLTPARPAHLAQRGLLMKRGQRVQIRAGFGYVVLGFGARTAKSAPHRGASLRAACTCGAEPQLCQAAWL